MRLEVNFATFNDDATRLSILLLNVLVGHAYVVMIQKMATPFSVIHIECLNLTANVHVLYYFFPLQRLIYDS